MAEPSADGIDVDSGAQEMSGAGMANGVRRWPFTVQFRKTIFQRARMARNDFMNAKARKQLTASVHEDALIARANRVPAPATLPPWRPTEDKGEFYFLYPVSVQMTDRFVCSAALGPEHLHWRLPPHERLSYRETAIMHGRAVPALWIGLVHSKALPSHLFRGM